MTGTESEDCVAWEARIPGAAARTWNNLLQHVTSAPSIGMFSRGRLKAFLIRRSLP